MAWGGPNTAQVLAPPPALFLGASLIGAALDKLLDVEPVGPKRVRRRLGAALVIAGFALEGWTAWSHKRRGTAVMPSKPTTALVTSGPYAVTRNPMYLGMVATFAGGQIFRGAIGPWLLLPGLLALVNETVISREERYLESRFGGDYRRYRARVPRWLWGR